MERLGRGSGKKSFFVPQSCMFLEGDFLSLDGPGHRPRELRWFHCQAFVPALLLSLQVTPPLSAAQDCPSSQVLVPTELSAQPWEVGLCAHPLSPAGELIP